MDRKYQEEMKANEELERSLEDRLKGNVELKEWWDSRVFPLCNWIEIELKTLFIHGILSLQSGILKSRALYNILIRSTNYALI